MNASLLLLDWWDSVIDAIGNRGLLTILMIVLIIFIVLLTVLGIVFIIALRKRRPVVKIVMAPQTQQQYTPAPAAAPAPVAAASEPSPAISDEPVATPAPVVEEVVEEPVPAPAPEAEPEEDDEASALITEGQETVRYNRSYLAKISQLNNDTKEWYSALKNDLLSYEKIKSRTSWRRESFRLGGVTVARIAVRGKTLCLMLAVEPLGYTNTKYVVEDVSNVVNTIDTPTMYRIKSARRLKYAKEMIAGMMKEFRAFKDPNYVPQDYFVPYEGDVTLMQKGLVKRVVSGTTRSYKIEELEDGEGDGEE